MLDISNDHLIIFTVKFIDGMRNTVFTPLQDKMISNMWEQVHGEVNKNCNYKYSKVGYEVCDYVGRVLYEREVEVKKRMRSIIRGSANEIRMG